MKCFERLRSTDDTVSVALHIALTYLEQPKSYVRVFFINVGSAFNTIIPLNIVFKLNNLEIDMDLYSWIMDFLTNRPPPIIPWEK